MAPDVDLSMMAHIPPPLEAKIRRYLELKGRGAHVEICQNTTLTAPEISNWIAGRRAMPPGKLVEMTDWLMKADRINVTLHL